MLIYNNKKVIKFQMKYNSDKILINCNQILLYTFLDNLYNFVLCNIKYLS